MLQETKRKKGQEEIVGFVLIVLIVSVVLVIFLSIFLRDKGDRVSDPEVTQFLDAIKEITSECSLNGGYSYLNYADLVEECNGGSLCSNGKKACDNLKEITKEMIELSWNFGPESVRKGYEFSAIYENEDGVQSDLTGFPLVKGPCSASFIGDERAFLARDGKIIIRLDLCL